MKTLDQLLFDRAVARLQDRLAEATDLASWTKENKEDKLTEIRACSKEVCDEAVQFVTELLSQEVDGKPLLWWKVLEQLIDVESEILYNYRDLLDLVKREELDKAAVDYTWLANKLHDNIVELNDIRSKTFEEITKDGETEEL